MLVDSHISQHPVPTNTATLRIASRLPQNIWDTLTDVQKTAIHAAITNRANNHIASLRSSIRLAGRRYYLALFFGHERRNVERLRDEGQLDRGEVSFIYIVLGILMLIFVIAHPSRPTAQAAAASDAGANAARRLASGLRPAMRPVATMEQRSA